jgi:hypothetical protein
LPPHVARLLVGSSRRAAFVAAVALVACSGADDAQPTVGREPLDPEPAEPAIELPALADGGALPKFPEREYPDARIAAPRCPPCGATFLCPNDTGGDTPITLVGRIERCETSTGIALDCGGAMRVGDELLGAWEVSDDDRALTFCRLGTCATCTR